MRNYTQVPDRACGAPGARKRARRVREAVRGNGPADKAGTAPRIDFTRLRHAWLRDGSLPAYGAKVTITPDGGISLSRGRWHEVIPAG